MVGRHIIGIIFGIVVAMALLLAVIFFAEPVADSGGTAHPLFPGMQVGGDGLARLEHIGVYAFLFMSLLMLLIVCFSILGVTKAKRTPEFLAYMSITAIVSVFIWWRMYAGHQEFLRTGETGYFLGFPVATAWATYGTWLAAIPLVAVYCFGFRKFILSKEDEEKYQRLLERSSEKGKS